MERKTLPLKGIFQALIETYQSVIRRPTRIIMGARIAHIKFLLENVHINLDFRCDVSQQSDWENIWTHTENHFEGKVSILINNAGVNPQHGWKATIDIMCFGVGLGTYMAIEKMGTSKVHHKILPEKGMND